jgi:hypothetical protein
VQVVHDFVDFCGPAVDDLADVVAHLANHAHIVLFLFLTHLPIALQPLLDGLQTLLHRAVVPSRGKPVTAVRLPLHFKFLIINYKLRHSQITPKHSK